MTLAARNPLHQNLRLRTGAMPLDWVYCPFWLVNVVVLLEAEAWLWNWEHRNRVDYLVSAETLAAARALALATGCVYTLLGEPADEQAQHIAWTHYLFAGSSQLSKLAGEELARQQAAARGALEAK